MNKTKKNVKLENNNQKVEEKKKQGINKTRIFIIIGIVLILLIATVLFLLNKEVKLSNITKENEIVEDDNVPVFEDKTIEEQKYIH